MKQKMIRILSAPVTYAGVCLHKGTIVGIDDIGEFFCDDFKIIKMVNNRPRLHLYRLSNDGTRWIHKVENNATTDAILDIYLSNDDLCDQCAPHAYIAQKAHIDSLGVATHDDFYYYHHCLRKGIIWGEDEDGIFICKNYKLMGRGDGYRNGYPLLVVWRYDHKQKHEKANRRDVWVSHIEASPTTAAIWYFYTHHKDECVISDEIDYKNVAKSATKEKKNNWASDGVHYSGQRYSRHEHGMKIFRDKDNNLRCEKGAKYEETPYLFKETNPRRPYGGITW